MLKLLDRTDLVRVLSIDPELRLIRLQTALRLITDPVPSPEDILLFKSFYQTRLDDFDDVSVCCEAHLLVYYQYKASLGRVQRLARCEIYNTAPPLVHCELNHQQVAELALALHRTIYVDDIPLLYRSKYDEACIEGSVRVTCRHNLEVKNFCREIHEAEEKRVLDAQNSIEFFCASVGFEVPDE